MLVGEGVSWNLITIWIDFFVTPPIAVKLVPGKGGGLEDWKILVISKGMMFRFYVSVPGCNRSALNKKLFFPIMSLKHPSQYVSIFLKIPCDNSLYCWLVNQNDNLVGGFNPFEKYS